MQLDGKRLLGKNIAILVEKDYEDLEVWFPALRLREEGAEVRFIGTTRKDLPDDLPAFCRVLVVALQRVPERAAAKHAVA